MPLPNAAEHSAALTVAVCMSGITAQSIYVALFHCDLGQTTQTVKGYLFLFAFVLLSYAVIIRQIIFGIVRRKCRQTYCTVAVIVPYIPLTFCLFMAAGIYMLADFRYNLLIYILFITADIASIVFSVFIFIRRQWTESAFFPSVDPGAIYNRTDNENSEYIKHLEKQCYKSRFIVHDIKGHLSAISAMDDVNEIRKYIKSLNANVVNISERFITGNKMLDIILTEYSDACLKLGIEFHTSVIGTNLSYIDDKDLCSLINNALCNAVDSACQSKNKRIDFAVQNKSNDVDLLTIVNSCSKRPLIVSGKLVSQKNNPKLHGIGTQSINNILKKYNADNNFEYDDEIEAVKFSIIFYRTKNNRRNKTA